ncbi:MAG TPA: endonuclease/exonuclease/phosphatase family protein [Polyangia bacterium]|jgi:endonuclease/exonuclease/phosphatase family metal-dependent hydrolase|nr:endonuclease/exonuclease/phosphatase family protein [Polyangia bacterium]
MALVRVESVEHALQAHFPALRAIRTRKSLQRSRLWTEIGAEVMRVLDGVERGSCGPITLPSHVSTLRAVAWNIQRGARLDDLIRAVTTPPLAGADLFLLSEVDVGLGRSGNRNVARELAEALGMNYAFGVSYLALTDDVGENSAGVENTLGLAGTAILSRHPIGHVENIDLPELRDKFRSSEKRLGKKRALLAEIALPDGPLVAAACHLDSTASPAQRAQQLAAVLDSVERSGVARALVGGDFNTSTYDASNTLSLVGDLLRKVLITGVGRAIDQYMTPDQRAERPVFDCLRERGFTVDGFNDRGTGTYFYDLTDPYVLERSEQMIGRALTRLLVSLTRRWGSCMPARLDWFAGRNVRPVAASVHRPRGAADDRPLSDHSAITVDVAV